MSDPPSFSSFSLSFSSFPAIEHIEDTGEEGQTSSGHHISEKKRLHHRDKESKKRRHEDRHRRGEGSTKEKRHSHSSLFLEDERAEHDPSRSYYSDRKGDPLNVTYGGIHGGDVPRYHLFAGGKFILGLSPINAVFRRTGKAIEIGARGIHKARELTDAKSRALLNAPATRRLDVAPVGADAFPEVDGVITWPKRRAPRDPEDSYRSVTRADDRHSDSEASHPEDEPDESSETDDEPLPTYHTERLKSLNQQLHDDPSSVDAWLSLLQQTLTTVPPSTKNAASARSDISLSILSKALSAAPGNERSRLLRLKYLKAGELVWHESVLRKEWQDALKFDDPEIRLEWLEWHIRNAKDGVNGIVDNAVEIISKLGDGPGSELMKVRVAWRCAVVFQNAGFSERGMALFQLLAELAFSLPPSFGNLPLDAQLARLEEFWESECPRVGESNSSGWATWEAAGHPEVIVPSRAKAHLRVINSFQDWVAAELEEDHASPLPMRSADDVDDPYSTILFADVRPLLFVIRTREAKHAFRRAWLSFLGLRFPGSSPGWDDRWNASDLVNTAHLDALFPSAFHPPASDAVAGVLIARERTYRDVLGPVKAWGDDVVEPLDIHIMPGGKARTILWSSVDTAGLDVSVIRNIFGRLRMGEDDAEWDAMYLAFEANVGLKNATKLSRSFLSEAGNSLLHWSAHAQLERLRGRLDDARKLFKAVLLESRPPPQQAGCGTLWHNYAEMEWLDGKPNTALRVVFSAANIEGEGGIAALRAKRYFADLLDDRTVSLRPKDREAWVTMLALTELLTTRDLQSALKAFDTYMPGGDAAEGSTVAMLLMIYRHAIILRSPTPPVILRERATAALRLFPGNSIILGLYLESEKGQGVWGRVKSMMDDDKIEKDVYRRTMEMWAATWDQQRWHFDIERARDSLLTALDQDRTKGSHILWRLYLELEIRTGRLQQAKKMVYRAIAECPLYKELYMLAMGPLRGMFSHSELRMLVDLMVERGIRIRYEVDHLTTDQIGNGGDSEATVSEGGDSEDEGEIAHNAQELRRLMPY
ncbi:hypothetical protein FISHEDRAFT_76294 [Fistulina hepatica ATCC 64428]|uniref:DUF1740-domain-containing protein n=1 Tax=Fistulina hepatica ATCC 64428 TaxID=1128425 RepID=A0A0D7A5S8_9AGAR|nr:hypothetical protein FISHEDRAFT_76294 [Fistulina hepatica ATCC 64428]